MSHVQKCKECDADLIVFLGKPCTVTENGKPVPHTVLACIETQRDVARAENKELKNEMYQAGWYHCFGCDRPVLENAPCPRCKT